MATPSSPVNLWVVLSESKRIINAHARHFLALSVLFLLPISFSVTVYPSVIRFITDQSTVSFLRSGDDDQQPPVPDFKMVALLLIAYVIIVTVLNLLAIGSIAYSVFQGLCGRPVKLISAVKSSLSSFFSLLATLITTFQVNWILSWVVVVVESVWGLTPLKRSKSLTKGMRSVSLSIIFFFRVTQSVIGWISKAAASAPIENGEIGWTNAFFVLQILVMSALLTLSTLYNLASITVMYMHCKAIQGELALEIAEEFAF
ncbi:unnamed protein product [Arabis nemorensis]|uniref:Transmembrane protein n=1 Tax=Arabis nemorensis TaxID=586526 RepID=A0A565BRG5_9BRAS|nr:unnamed protein product [Arabis nemorensis]